MLVTKAEFSLVCLPAARHPLIDLPGALTIVRMKQPLPGTHMRFDLVVVVAEHLLPLRRVHDRSGFEIPVPDPFLRAGEREREAFFALTKRRLGLFAFRQIEVGAHNSDHRPAVLTPNWKTA